MRRFFTSDLHLGSSLINKYANRPYNSAEEALTILTTNINTTLGKNDVLIHVGDFMLAGADRHDKIADWGLKYKLDDYLDMLEPNVILVAGNYDDGHNTETVCKGMTVNLNQNWKNVSVGHYASDSKIRVYDKSSRKIQSKIQVNKYYGKTQPNAKFPHVHLCGHVHDKWLLNFDRINNVLNINVGVDVWGYRPVEDVELTQVLDFIKTAKVPMPKDKMTCDDILTWDKQNEMALKKDRESRKLDRYKKKGLTPEECKRRKEEAMRKKGLDPNFKKTKPKSKKEDSFSHEDAVQFGMLPPDTIEGPSEI